MKKKKPIRSVQVGPRVEIDKNEFNMVLSFGQHFPTWDDIPDEVMENLEQANDTSLFEDVRGFYEMSKDWSDIEIMSYARSLVPVDRMPNLGKNSSWVFWPSVHNGFAYAKVKM